MVGPAGLESPNGIAAKRAESHNKPVFTASRGTLGFAPFGPVWSSFARLFAHALPTGAGALLLYFAVACGASTEPGEPAPDMCPADAKCILTSTPTNKPLPDPPIVYSCTVPVGCEADYVKLCSTAPFHTVCGR